MSHKVYVDTCILSRIYDKQISDENVDALDELCDLDAIDFVTSKKTFEEFLETSDKKKRVALKLLYKIITKIPPSELIRDIPPTLGSKPLGTAAFASWSRREDSLFTGLKTIFDENDAEHIFHAIKSQCEYFLTLDRRTILDKVSRNRDLIEETCPQITFVSPIDLLRKIELN